MKNTKKTRNYLIVLMGIFTLIVVLVEAFKKIEYNAHSTVIIDHAGNSPYLLGLPLISIAILFFMAVPRTQIYKLGYYATTLGLILINRLK